MLKNLELETVLYGIPCFVQVISAEPFKYEIYSKKTSGRLDSLESLLNNDDVELLRIDVLSLFPELETSTASLKTKTLTEQCRLKTMTRIKAEVVQENNEVRVFDLNVDANTPMVFIERLARRALELDLGCQFHLASLYHVSPQGENVFFNMGSNAAPNADENLESAFKAGAYDGFVQVDSEPKQSLSPKM